jgi:hypothetical protein
LLGVSSPIWVLGVIFVGLGAGIVIIMPSANECLMSALPRGHAGCGSGINSTVRQVAEALGVAVLGSILGYLYRRQMNPRLRFLPGRARKSAGESIAETLAVAQRLGPAGARLADPARIAFVSAMHVALTAAVAAACLGAVVVLTWMPGRHDRAAPLDPRTAAARRGTAAVTPAAPASAVPDDRTELAGQCGDR